MAPRRSSARYRQNQFSRENQTSARTFSIFPTVFQKFGFRTTYACAQLRFSDVFRILSDPVWIPHQLFVSLANPLLPAEAQFNRQLELDLP